MNNRIEYLDIAKALGIIFVVIGHSGMVIGKFIYLFHMPLFFLISGYFYKDKYSYSFLDFLIKRIKSLYIPFLQFELVFLLLHNIFFSLNIYSGNPNTNAIQGLYSANDYLKNAFSILFFNGTELLLAPLWFLTVLFIVNIMFWLISKIALTYGEGCKLILTLLCFCFGNFFTKIKFGIINSIVFVPEAINVSMVAVFIFYLGYLYRQYEHKVDFNSKQLLLISVLILLLLREYGEMDMRRNFYPDPAFMLTGTILGTYLTFYISKHISNRRIIYILSYVGKNTIPIMALHILSFKLVTLIQIAFLGLPYYMLGNFPIIQKSWWGILYSVVGIGIPILLVYVKEKLFNSRENLEPIL